MNIQPIFVATALSALATGHLSAVEPVITWSRTYDSGSANNVISVYQRATGVDGAGNVFVLGRTDSEWAVVKYLPDGSSSWTNRFRGSATGSASGYNLAVDASGNAHVTGYYSAPDISGARLVTVKYLPDGTAAWTNYFTGIGYGVALDEGGNVYVAGSSGAFGTGADFITLKYRSDGTAVWTNRYNGPGPSANDADDVRTLAVDGAGNVVVTGTSQRPGGGSDFATVKYQTDGTPVWTNRYGEAGFTFASVSDVAVDGSGGVYVTGGSRGASGATSDYLAIKYHADGTPLWTNRFNSLGNGLDWAGSVKVNREGDVYVRGGSYGKNNYVIKYNSAGAVIWTNVFEGTSSTEGEGLALDGDGNIFMAAGTVGNGTGPDIAVIQYLPNGTAVRTNRFIGQGDAIDTATSLAVDHLGNVFVAATSTILGLRTTRSLMVRYPADGTPGWTNFFGIPVPGNDQVTKAVADAAGNIYVIGDTWGYGTASDYLCIKFQADGTPVWTNRYDALHNFDDIRDIAVDSAGNVYVTGNSRLNGDDSDYLTIKYLADGTPAWTNRFNPTLNDYASGIVVDNAGNVYVTGNTGHGEEAVTIKYRSDGTTAWTGRFRGTPYGTYAYAIAIDGAGSVCVAGLDQTNGWFAIKYQPNGLALWTNHFNSGRGADAYAIAVDNSDNVYVSGVSSSGSYSYDDYIVVKYQADGTAMWTNRYDGPASGSDVARAIEVDNAGNAYVTGVSGLMFSSNAGADYATIKYRTDGTAVWTNRYDGLGNGSDSALGLAVDRMGNIFVTGGSTSVGTGMDHATIKYRPDGTAAWTNRWSGSASLGSDWPVSVIPVSSGDVVVAGTVVNADGSNDWILYRLADAPEQNQVNLALIPDLGVRLRFAGVPGQAYQVQRAPSASGPWAVLSTLTAPPHGMIEYIDSNRSPEGAFYRTATP